MSGHFAKELCDEVWATRVGQSGRSSTRHNYKAGSVCRVMDIAVQSKIESSPPFTFLRIYN